MRIPSRGLGTFQADPKLYPEGSVKASVLRAIKHGYRHIDAAYGYGSGFVGKEVGAAIAECGVPREELFVVTKLHHCFHAPDDVERQMRLGFFAYEFSEGYVTRRKADGKPVLDWPLTKAYDVTWAAMELLQGQGKAKLIGTSPKLPEAEVQDTNKS
ncbi:hypothetical protein WAI453_002355 [Rhynchosporium graminicola]